MRTAYDFSPLYRSVIGIERMVDLIDSAMRNEGDRSYPPCDVEKTSDDNYRITLAATGFVAEELEVTAQPNLLIVTARKAGEEVEGGAYLHRGIARRNFERQFELADYVVVRSASYESGVLTIDLAREAPEAVKPRRIEIGGADGSPNLRRVDGDQTGRRAA